MAWYDCLGSGRAAEKWEGCWDVRTMKIRVVEDRNLEGRGFWEVWS